MTQEEMIRASSDPKFLEYLEIRQKDVLSSKDIQGLYEVLDMLLILDLQEERINQVYETILMVAFENIEKRLKSGIKLKLDDNSSYDKYYIRAFYEHSIEKWSKDDYKGAKELFFVLNQIIDDEKLSDALNIKLLACYNNIEMDKFYDESILHKEKVEDEKYGYFLVDFKFDTKEYLHKNKKLLKDIYEELKSLLKV